MLAGHAYGFWPDLDNFFFKVCLPTVKFLFLLFFLYEGCLLFQPYHNSTLQIIPLRYLSFIRNSEDLASSISNMFNYKESNYAPVIDFFFIM